MPLKNKLPGLFLALMVLGGGDVLGAGGPPGDLGVDAPELARPGPAAVGVRALALIDRKQEAVLNYDATTHQFPKENRELTVDLWYPAQVAAGAPRETYV